VSCSGTLHCLAELSGSSCWLRHDCSTRLQHEAAVAACWLCAAMVHGMVHGSTLMVMHWFDNRAAGGAGYPFPAMHSHLEL
jgi:hypothetical protein